MPATKAKNTGNTKMPTATNSPATTAPPSSKAAYDLDHHLVKMTPTTRALFELLRDQIMNLGDDVTERFMNQYIGYRRLRNFTEIVGLKGKMNIFIDGAVTDSAGICEDVTNIGHWGTGNLRATVASEDDVLAVVPLISQAYALQE